MDQLNNLDAIIFDLGEVIVDLNPEAVISAFADLTNGQGQELRELIVSSPYLYQFETGQLSEEAFVEAIGQLLNTTIDLDQFRYAWNLMIGAIPLKRLELMRQLQKSHQVYILSNTNITHERHFDELVFQHQGLKMGDYVHEAYYSHVVGMRKPNTDIFEYVTRQNKLEAGRCLFLDDKAENIVAAKGAGWQAIQVQYPDQIFEILE